MGFYYQNVLPNDAIHNTQLLEVMYLIIKILGYSLPYHEFLEVWCWLDVALSSYFLLFI